MLAGRHSGQVRHGWVSAGKELNQKLNYCTMQPGWFLETALVRASYTSTSLSTDDDRASTTADETTLPHLAYHKTYLYAFQA